MKRDSKKKKAGINQQTPASTSPPNRSTVPAETNPPRQDRTVLWCVLLFLVTTLAFLPSLRGTFVDFDDPTYITANSHVLHGLTIDGLKWAFSSTETSNWHPLTWISHMVDCQLYGLKPWGHHLTNVILHALNATLLFLVLRRMTGATWRSLFVAAVFGLHPLRVESVAWISERKDVLSTLFWMLALWSYVRFTEESKLGNGKGKKFYAFTALLFALGLMSKPMLVTFPCILLLVDYWPLKRILSKSRPSISLVQASLEKIPFFLLAAAASAITVIAQHSVGAVATVSQFSLETRVANALVSYSRYLGKLLCPMNLSVLYPHPNHWPAATVGLTTAFLVAITIFAVARWRKQPYLPIGWFWFLGMLVPTIGLVQVGSQAMADRYSYVPTVGILLALTWGVCELTAHWQNRTKSLTIAGTLAVASCIIITELQIPYWRDNEALFRRATVATTDNFLAYNSLGAALYSKGRFDEATAAYRASVASYPGYSDARHNLIAILIRSGQLDEAASQITEGKRFHVDFANLHYSLGLALRDRGRTDESILQLSEALSLNPDNAAAHSALGALLVRKGRTDEAIAHLQAAIQKHPEDSDAHLNLGLAFAGKGRMDDALSQFEEAQRLRPDSAEPHNWLGAALVEKGRADEGITHLREAIKIRPDFADAHNNLGTALLRKGLIDEAIEHYQTALKLRPNYADAQNNLKAAQLKKSNPVRL